MSAPGKRVRGRRALNLAAIYSLLFLNNGGLLIPPAIDVMATAFPHEPYSRVLLISTLPSLVALPFILLSGNLAGTRIRYRTLLLFVIPVYIISGTLPFFLTDLNGVLACRAVYGVCFGLVGPRANALILRNYEGEDQIRFLGYGSVIIGLAGIVYQQLAGFLSLAGWNFVFLGHLVAVIPLFLVLFGLVEPAACQPPPAGVPDTPRPPLLRSLLRPNVIGLFLLMCSLYICSQTKMMTVSSIVASEGMGDSTVSAAILSMATVGALLTGLALPVYCRCVTRYRVPILILVLSLTTVTNLLHSPVLIGAGYSVGTMAFMMNLNLMTLRASQLFRPKEASRAVSLIQCADKGGVFLATYFTTFCGWLVQALQIDYSVYKAPVVGALLFYLLLAIADAVWSGPGQRARPRQ